jgi:hypothetical protein
MPDNRNISHFKTFVLGKNEDNEQQILGTGGELL